MCVGDYRLSRYVKSVPRAVTLGIAGTAAIPANNLRVGLGIYSQDTLQLFVLSVSDEGTDVPFFASTTAVPFLELMQVVSGDFCHRAFTLTSPAGGSYVIVDWLLPASAVDSRIDEFISKGY